MTAPTDQAAVDVAEEPVDPVLAERRALELRWLQRHGVEAAGRLAAAENFADALARELVPENTTDTYAKSWRVWTRFTTATGLPLLEGSRGALVAFAAWLLREGRQSPGPGGVLGYAPNSASTHLAAAVVGLRRRGAAVTRDDAATAATALEGMVVQLLKAGERRGRGPAPTADVDGLRAIAAACPDTLTGVRDKALVLTSFHYASRASEPAGLLLADVTVHARGLVVEVLTGTTTWSVRSAKIPYAQDPALCPVRAWIAWRERLLAEGGPQYADPSGPAFHGIDRHGHIHAGIGPDAVTRAITRISQRCGVDIRWTGHSLRSGLATEGRRNKRDAIAIARQGGWAPNSKSMLGYMRTADEWDDNASAGLA